MITLNKDDNDFNIESYCVTNNARQPRVCMRKKQNKYMGKKSVRKAKTRPKQPKSGQNSRNQARRDKRRQTGHFYSCVFVFFPYTHGWVFCVVSHAIALNIGMIIIFIKCNHKGQCLIKKFRSCFSIW